MSTGMEPEVKEVIPLADLSAIDRALAGGERELRETACRFRPADLGRDLSRRPIDDGVRLCAALDDRRAAAMLRAAHPAVSGQILVRTPPERVARVLGFVATDHQVEILATVEPDKRVAIENALDPEAKATVRRLIAHDPLAVARLMTPKIWRTDARATAGDALAILRSEKDDIEVAVNLYVVERARLVGVIPLREVVLAPAGALLADIMTPDPIAVREDTPRGDAADIIRMHDFLSLPVVDGEGRLVGAVRVDDVLDAVLDRVGDGFLNQGGVAGKIAGKVPYFLTPIVRTVRSRLTWLILLFVAETLTGTVLRYFEDSLAKVVALSFFVPLLIGTGGNAGSQTIATVIRAHAIGEVRDKDLWRVVRREVTAGLLLGLLVATIGFCRALLWGVGADLALCVAITIMVVVTWANGVGATIPLLAHRIGIDPTVISGPLITTLVDATGLFIYFSVAHLTIAELSARDTGARYECAIVERGTQAARGEGAPLPACDPEKPEAPCWRVIDTDDRTRLRLSIDRGGAAPPAGTTVTTRCAPSPAPP